VELDIIHTALLIDEGVGVHAKALHVAVVGGDADVVLQEGELRSHPTSSQITYGTPSSQVISDLPTSHGLYQPVQVQID